jgi:hypothetical protein
MPPERSDLVLSSYIPNVELYILISHSLDVESYCWNGSDVLADLELVEYCCKGQGSVSMLESKDNMEPTSLSCSIQSKHQQAHFF